MKLGKDKYSLEYKKIAKLIFDGYTKEEIAKILNYSRSTVTNRMNKMFEEYQANSRISFIIAVFSRHTYELREKNILYQDLLRNFIKFFEELNLSLENKKLALFVNKAKELIDDNI